MRLSFIPFDAEKGRGNMGTKDKKEIIADVKLKLEGANKIYEDLLKQRDSVKSVTLFKLLDEEIKAFVNLSQTFVEYLHLHVSALQANRNNTSEYLNESLKSIEEIEDKKIAAVLFENIKNTYEIMCALDDLGDSALDLSIGNFVQAVSRDFKDWEEVIKMLISNAADWTGNVIPGIAEIKGLYDNVKSAAELMNAFEENGTDYSDVDEKLLKIDTHIELMQMVNEHFVYMVEFLKSKQEA